MLLSFAPVFSSHLWLNGLSLADGRTKASANFVSCLSGPLPLTLGRFHSTSHFSNSTNSPDVSDVRDTMPAKTPPVRRKGYLRLAGAAMLRKRKSVAKAKKEEDWDTDGASDDGAEQQKGKARERRLPVWKWFVVGYAAWIGLSYTFSYTYHRGWAALSATVCPIPILGHRLAFCHASTPSSSSTPPESDILIKLISAQEDIATVAGRVGRDRNLSRQIIHHQFAVRDLRVRVGGSSLPRKQELVRHLQSLFDHTKQVAR